MTAGASGIGLAIAETLKVIGYSDMETQYLEQISLRKMVTVQDVANQALFLCSSTGASISGQAIGVLRERGISITRSW